ncbi:hypothetical protein C6P46_000377 [Rhodotorula mucilaginosa]|uniref:Uncharacterized protein n=1 Tax=Rhodotorula mucilaginosa TaxID=5537 RepID=A0A9P7B3H0_RHOMI|nr:hypothetical protein C6P46_000377 [Rhodotorula mucilaginosa]
MFFRRRQGGRIRLPDDDSRLSVIEEKLRGADECLPEPVLAPARLRSRLFSGPTVSLAAWFTLTCGWLTLALVVARFEPIRVAILSGAKHPILSTLPLLLACPAAAYTFTAVRCDSQAARVVIRLITPAVFALPWLLIQAWNPYLSPWQAAYILGGLAVYEVALVLWSVALADERAESKSLDTPTTS